MFNLYENVVDLAASKKTGGGGSADLPFGETPRGTENLFKGITEYPNYDNYGGQPGFFYLKDPKLNLNKSYDIIIRGDVYANVPCKKVNNYYEFAVWGDMSFSKYPFYLEAVWPWYDGDPTLDRSGNWDSDGNWVAAYGSVDYWAYPQINVDPEKYPDLKPEEIEIYEPGTLTKMSGKYVEGMGYVEDGVVHPIDPKYLPSAVENVKVVHMTFPHGEGTAPVIDATYDEILEAINNGTFVVAVDTTNAMAYTYSHIEYDYMYFNCVTDSTRHIMLIDYNGSAFMDTKPRMSALSPDGYRYEIIVSDTGELSTRRWNG